MARGLPATYHSGCSRSFSLPLSAASACGLGNPYMATKTKVTVKVLFDVAATARWVCLLILALYM